MPTIELVTFIAAPIERVFDLARSIDLHANSTSRTGERAIAGVTSGLIGPGQEVTWRARHFGVWQSLTVRVTVFERPTHFADAMLRGAFRSMEHHHYFEQSGSGTTMRDVFSFQSPLGILGRIGDVLFLTRYMKSFLIERNRVIKATAESDGWNQYIGDGQPLEQQLAQELVAPWLCNEESAAGKITFSGDKDAAQGVVFAVVVNLVLAVAAWLLIRYEVFGKGNWWALLPLVLPAIGLLLIFLAIAEVRRWRAFGSSVLEMASVPGVIGGRLAGVIRTSAKVRVESGFRLTLNCFRSELHGGEHTDTIAWQEEQIIACDLLPNDPGHSAIPVLFQIPYGCLPTNDESREPIRWRLKVTAKSAGPTYRAAFDVPVFKTHESDPCFVADPSLIAGYAAPERPDADLREAGILKIASPTGEGWRFVFPMARTPILATSVALFGFLFGSIPFLIWCLPPPGFWFSFIVAVVLAGGLSLLLLAGSADTWLFRSTVDVSSRGLDLTAGWFGLGRLRHVEGAELDRIETKIDAIMANIVVYYNNVAVCRDRKVTLGKRVRGKRLAEAVCREIDRARAQA